MLKVKDSEIKSVIFDNPEFACYSERTDKRFEEWRVFINPKLNDLQKGIKPKELILSISESLLSVFSKDELIDKYDVYQRLMDYWSETMQDDVYLIAVTGWKVEINKIKNKKGKEIGWTHDLLPKEIAVIKYFSKEQEAIDNLTAELEKVAQQMRTLEEETNGEDDLFSDARSASGKITKKEITKRIKEIRSNWECGDELKALQEYLHIIEQEAEIKRKLKNAKTSLEKKLLVRYKTLTEEEIKALVIEDKWLKSLYASLKSEMESISQKFASRIKELAERYEVSLPKLVEEVEKCSKTVDNHLKKMGFKW